jgi:triosephosphate isomerase
MLKLLAANWKENPASEKEALRLFGVVAGARRENVEVAVCPPFIYLEDVAAAYRKLGRAAKKDLFLGAQDAFWEESGPFTGEVGPKMLRQLGVAYAIIGHSERRKHLNETDAMINKKIRLALRDGLAVILCVGEPPAIRRKGNGAVRRHIKNQLTKDLAGVFLKSPRMSGARIPRIDLTIAYEPIWAIGSGRNDSPEDAAAIARFIKDIVHSISPHAQPRVLYGGSVNGSNVRDYVQYKEIDGALVGGASLKGVEFKKMIARVGGL